MCEITWGELTKAPTYLPPLLHEELVEDSRVLIEWGRGHRRRRALVLLDRNHVHRPRNPAARDAGAGVITAGAATPTEMMLDAPLFVLDNSVAVVVAREDGTNVPAAVACIVSRIVFDSPAARSPAVQVRVMPLNSAGAEPVTSVSPAKLMVAAAAVAVAV